MIHRIVIPNTDIRSQTALEMVNVGDRGSLDPGTGGTWINSTTKDGFDDFAVLFQHKDVSDSSATAVWIIDGRRGIRYNDPAGLPLEYLFNSPDFAVSNTGMCGDGGKDVIGDSSYPDLVIGAPGYNNGVGAIFILDMKLLDPGSSGVVRIDAPAPPTGGTVSSFGASVSLLGHFRGDPKAELLVGAPYSTASFGGRSGGRVYILEIANAVGGGLTSTTIASIEGPTDVVGTGVDTSLAFGIQTALIGNVATKVSSGTKDVWGRDGTPEFVVALPGFVWVPWEAG